MTTPLNVLILEDNPADAELLLHELKRSGFDPDERRVQTEADYLAHLDAALDLILADYSLPQFDGLRALQLLQERGLDIPFILVSGTIGEDIAVEAMKRGAADYLLKDRLARLGSAIIHVLEQKKLREEKRQADKTLRESEERFRLLSESSLTGIYLLQDQRYSYVNPAFASIFGYKVEEIVGRLSPLDFAHPDDRANILEDMRHRVSGETEGVRYQRRGLKKDGSIVYVEFQGRRIEYGGKVGIIGTLVDITERKQAEERLATQYMVARALAESATLAEAAPQLLRAVCESLDCDHAEVWSLLWSADLQAKVLRCTGTWHPPSLSFPEFETATREIEFPSGVGLPGRVWSSGEPAWIPDVTQDANFPRALIAAKEGLHAGFAFPIQLGSQVLGVMGFLSREIRPPDDDTLQMLTSVSSQISQFIEGKQAEGSLKESEEYFRSLIENASDVITVLDGTGTILYESPSIERVLGYKPEELLGQNAFELVHPEELADTTEAFARGFQSPESAPLVEARFRHKDGSWRVVEMIGKPALGRAGQVIGIVNSRDITERKQAEAVLWETESQLRTVLNNAPITIFTTDSHGIFTLSEGKGLEHVGLKPGENVGVSAFDLFGSHPFLEYSGKETTGEGVIRRVLAGEEVTAITELRGVYFDNHIGPLRGTDGKVVGIVGVAIDITERKHAEEGLKLFRTLVDRSNDAIEVVDPETLRYLDVNEKACLDLGYSREELLSLGALDIDADNDPSSGQRILEQLQKSASLMIESHHRRKDGTLFPVEVNMKYVQLDRGYIVTVVRDITERKRGEERIQRQLEQLNGLSLIDRAITASFELRLTLNILLEQVTAQLHVDAAAVLLHNTHLHTLEFSSGRGFRTKAIESTRLRLGEGYAGRAVLERQMVHAPNLSESSGVLVRTYLTINEAFVAYYAVPLIAKGQVKGVLEIFHRSLLNPDQEWLDFLDTLAGQAAIAIDNAELFNGLHRSNAELRQAYDATIEGWSRALDLRDKETEGHTQRVTEMTLRLAETMGQSDEESIHIRRGALLHDMGKLGVPDNILLKPDKLSDDEWGIMKKHPQYAYDMLSPVDYLRRALDIPYCHHEKWDGTGYPRGLKGEQIPLVARIFAVVDVWDALRSDRPYRPGWSEEKVREYILEQSGKHFDPRVAEMFLRMTALGSK